MMYTYSANFVYLFLYVISNARSELQIGASLHLAGDILRKGYDL